MIACISPLNNYKIVIVPLMNLLNLNCILFFRKDYIRVNGMSNRYWGWGLEDDEFYVRVKSFGIPIIRPLNITTGVENTFKYDLFTIILSPFA